MPVTSVAEIFEGRSGSDDSKQQVSLTRTFRVITNSPLDDVPVIVGAAGIPLMYAQHPAFLAAYVTGRSASQQDDPKVWKVTVSYSSNMDTVSPSATPSAPPTAEVARQQQGSAPGERVSAPLSRPTDVSYSTVDNPRLLIEDFSEPAEPVLNSANEQFDPPIETEDTLISLQVEFNAATFNVATWQARVKTTNATTFQATYAPRTLLLKSVSAKRVYENGVKYFRISLDVVYNADDWDILVLNKSYSEMVNGKKVAAGDGKGHSMPNGVVLGTDGTRLAVGVPPTVGNGGWLLFRKYHAADWSWFIPIYSAIL